MASAFGRTLRSLDVERLEKSWLRLAFALVLLSVWVTFMVSATVTVYATAAKGRLEVSRMAHRVGAPEAGRVVRVDLELGREVSQGQLLVELDASVEEKRLAEEQTKAAVISDRLLALRRQIDEEREVRSWQSKLAQESLARAEIDVRQREAAASYSGALQNIAERLSAQRIGTEIANIEAQTRGTDERLKAEGARADIRKLSVMRGYDDRRALARIAELERVASDLEAERTEALAAVETARAQIERLKIRAPIAGKLGNIATLQVGDVIRAGDNVATVVPSEDVHAVGLFSPEDAVGRIMPGQKARVRLDGFAWTQFGMLEGRVEHIGSEPNEGAIRVELVLDRPAGNRIPIQHGVPGAIEVEVDHVSPWTLLVRSVVPR